MAGDHFMQRTPDIDEPARNYNSVSELAYLLGRWEHDAGDGTLHSLQAYAEKSRLDILVGSATTLTTNDGDDRLIDSDGVHYARGDEGNDTLTISFASNWIGAGGAASNVVTLDGNGGGDRFDLGSANSAQNLINEKCLARSGFTPGLRVQRQPRGNFVAPRIKRRFQDRG